MRMEYTKWYDRVEAQLLKLCGLDQSCLPDWRYVLDYEEGFTPLQTAKRVIRYAKSS
jgi:hypothetical protein